MMPEVRRLGVAPTALLAALAEGPMTRAEVKSRLDLDWRQTTNAARALLRLGYLHIMADGRYGLTPEGVAAAARGETITGGPRGQVKIRRDTLRARAWAAIRVRRTFTIGEIVADAERGDEVRPRDNITRYIARLKAAGFVRECAERRPGTAPGSNGFKRFILVRDPGRCAPVFRQDAAAVHDPNTGEDVPCAHP